LKLGIYQHFKQFSNIDIYLSAVRGVMVSADFDENYKKS